MTNKTTVRFLGMSTYKPLVTIGAGFFFLIIIINLFTYCTFLAGIMFNIVTISINEMSISCINSDILYEFRTPYLRKSESMR